MCIALPALTARGFWFILGGVDQSQKDSEKQEILCRTSP